MRDLPATHSSPLPSAPAELERRYGERWKIALESSRGVWSAERRSADGKSLRVIIAHSAAEMIGKLEAIEGGPS